jgi:hypothetical protein
MKKVLFIMVCAMGIVSCGPKQPIEGSNKSGQIGDYNVITIDGCEYLEYRAGAGESRVYSLTHKGNCKNHGHF